MPRKPRDYAAEYARRVAGTPKGSRERQIARGHAASERPGQIRHVAASLTRPTVYPEMWVSGKPGPKGGGRPTAAQTLKAVREHTHGNNIRMGFSVMATPGSELDNQTKAHTYGALKGQEGSTIFGAVVRRQTVVDDLTAIAALPPRLQATALATAVGRWTSREGEIREVLTISMANR